MSCPNVFSTSRCRLRVYETTPNARGPHLKGPPGLEAGRFPRCFSLFYCLIRCVLQTPFSVCFDWVKHGSQPANSISRKTCTFRYYCGHEYRKYIYISLCIDRYLFVCLFCCGPELYLSFKWDLISFLWDSKTVV